MILRDVVIALSSRDVPEFRTQASLAAATAQGATSTWFAKDRSRGCPGLALARNRSLTAALEAKPARAFVATVDDDIVFEVEQLAQLVELAKKHDRPVAAAYPNEEGVFQCMPLGAGRFATGLGCVVFPWRVLEEYAQTVERVPWANGASVWAFCQEGPASHPVTGERHWVFDDYWLAYALGGFVLAPVVVRHVKKVPLGFPVEELARLLSGS